MAKFQTYSNVHEDQKKNLSKALKLKTEPDCAIWQNAGWKSP
jgi:hypothetical protein